MNYVITLVLLLTLGGCVSPAAITAIDRGIAANKGHMNDEGLPSEAREIGQDNYDLLNQVKFNLNGTDLPEDTAARAAARNPDPPADDGGGDQ